MAEPQFWGLEDNWLTVQTTAVTTAARPLVPIVSRSKRREHRSALQGQFIHPPAPTQNNFNAPHLLVPVEQAHTKRREHRVARPITWQPHIGPLRLPIPSLLVPLAIPKSRHRIEKRQRTPLLFQAHGGPLRLPVPRLLVPIQQYKPKHRVEKRQREPLLGQAHGGPLRLPVPRLLVPLAIPKAKHRLEKRQREPFLGQPHGGPLARPVPRLLIPLELPRSKKRRERAAVRQPWLGQPHVGPSALPVPRLFRPLEQPRQKRREHRVVPARLIMPPPPTVTPFFIPYPLRPAYIDNRAHHRTRPHVPAINIYPPIPNPPPAAPQVGPSYGGYPWWRPFWEPSEDVRRRMLQWAVAPDLRGIPQPVGPVALKRAPDARTMQPAYRTQARMLVVGQVEPLELVPLAKLHAFRHEWLVIDPGMDLDEIALLAAGGAFE